MVIIQTWGWFISSGNAVVIKPSEVCVHTAKVMEDLLPLYIDKVSRRQHKKLPRVGVLSYYTGIVLS